MKDPYKLFVIGLGRQGQAHIKLLNKRNDVTIVGGYDISSKAFDSATDFLQIFHDLAEGLQKTLPDIILIATPPKVRFELFSFFTSIPSIKAILIEKPMATCMKDAFAMHDLSATHGWHLFIVHQSRFMKEFISLKEAITNKRIGELKHIKASCYGNLFNQGSHNIDLIRWMTNNQRIVWVDATGSNDIKLLNQLTKIQGTHEPDMDHPGNMWSTINMRLESGVEILLTCGMLDSNPLPELGPWFQRRITAVGTHGYAEAHLASYYREIIQGNTQSESYNTSTEQYLSSFELFYEDIFSTMDRGDNIKILKDMEDNISTLAILIAALTSAERHKIIPMPSDIQYFTLLDNYLSSNKSNEDLPIISVIIPFLTHRGVAQEALSSWTQDQLCNSESFEVIGVYSRNEEYLVPLLKKSLRLHDQLVLCDSNNEIELFHHGAKLAKGSYLLFTESHCFAEPEALQQAIKLFRHENCDIFYPRTTAIHDNILAAMENRLYQQEINKSDCWDKVTLHALGIKKEIYFSLGGFDYRYNRFATALFGAKLNQHGYPLVYAPAVGVKHYFANKFSILDIFFKEFTQGECSYRIDTTDKAFCYNYFLSPLEWALARGYNRQLDAIILKNLLKLFPRRSYYKLVLRNIHNFLLRVLFGKCIYKSQYYFSRLISKMTYLISTNKSKLKWDSYINYIYKTMSYYRVNYASTRNNTKNTNNITHYPLTILDEINLYGFHTPEITPNEAFRWSSGISAIQLFIKPGNYNLRIKIPGSASHNIGTTQPITFFINTSKVKDVKFDFVNMEFNLSLPPSYFSKNGDIWLIIISHPLKTPKNHPEKRELGIPVKELLFEST